MLFNNSGCPRFFLRHGLIRAIKSRKSPSQIGYMVSLLLIVLASPYWVSMGFAAGNAIANVTGTSQTNSSRNNFDYDGDGKADLAIFRPADGNWYILKSSTNTYTADHFGQDGDIPVSADYDGDGKNDEAVFRGGFWYRRSSSDQSYTAIQFGQASDLPVPADFDGDGKAEVAVYRPSTGVWYTLQQTTGSFKATSFGVAEDIPAPTDYDGDGKADICVFRPSTGTWYRLNSRDGSFYAAQFGSNGDVPVQGDYDKDGRADVAVWRPSSGVWYVLKSSDQAFIARQFGISSDIPVPADFDGDGANDYSVFRPSEGVWYVQNSSVTSFSALRWGTQTDLAANGKYPRGGGPRTSPSPTPTPSPSPTPTATPTITPTPTPTATPTPTPTSTPTPTPTPSPTITPTPTPTATPTPSPTPPPTGSFTCDYYASTAGTPSGSGTSASPWDLKTALKKNTVVVTGTTLCLRGGTYVGKYMSTLNGGTVRSAPGEWARIDGYQTITLSTALDTVQTTFTLSDSSALLSGSSDDISIGGEIIKTYTKSGNNVTSSLRGASGSLNGPEPHAAGSIAVVAGTQLTIYGTNTIYRDFEVTNSRPGRDGNIENQNLARGNGISVVSDGNKLVNLIVHDNLSGITTSSSSSNTEIYGCLSYNNGMHKNNGGVEDGYGHGFYLENKAGYSRVYEDIVLNNFNLGMQGYGMTAPYVGGDILGSIFANSGSPLGKFGDLNRRNRNLIVGPESVVSPTALLRDSFTFHPVTSNGYSVDFGYGAGVSTGTITGNTFVGGNTLLIVSNTSAATVTGNKFYAPQTGALYTISRSGMTYTWNNNTYYGSSGRDTFGISGVGRMKLPSWQSTTGFDSSSTETTGAMPDTVQVRPNTYQPGRANVIIFSFSGATSVTVNLSSTGLVNGQTYTIRNAQNYFGSPVVSGTYNSSQPTISVPLTGAAQTVATPGGYSFTPASTCPQFCPMVVVPN